jgi:hypothetical protein
MMKHLLLAAIGLIGCAALAKAQTFPTRPVSIIVTSAPGGAADATARAVAGQLAKSSRPIERHFMSTGRALMNYRPELVGWKAFPCGSDTSFHFQPSSDREPWNTAPLW